ncbi:hypothetical protein N8Z95_00605 [bacterium]|nr:hypothetical protein [bacterium]MDC1304050.1 hypothetical protein [Salibacteraceae bacterium]
MKNLITILSLICILPFAGLSASPTELVFFRSADSLRAAGLIDDAIIAYEYAAYTAINNLTRTKALVNKADCLLEKDRIGQSELTLSRLNYFGLNDSLQYEARYKSALYSYLNKNFEESIAQFKMIQQFLPIEYSINSKPLYALALNETREWTEAKEQLHTWGKYHFSEDTAVMNDFNARINETYQVKNHPKLKDLDKAQVWAQLLPGTGQLYSGYFFDAAFTSVMVLSGIGIAAYGVLVAKYYVTGILLGYGVFQQFYLGGQKRSEFLANERNYKKERAYNDLLKEVIIKYSKTKKAQF